LSQFDKIINYEKLLVKEKVKEYRLYTKQELCITQAKNKFLEKSLCKNKIRTISLYCLRNNYFDNKINKLALKRKRFA
jgi:hypothetical protein